MIIGISVETIDGSYFEILAVGKDFKVEIKSFPFKTLLSSFGSSKFDFPLTKELQSCKIKFDKIDILLCLKIQMDTNTK